MLRQERDFILRLIAAAAAAVARLRQRLSGGAAPNEVAREARAAQVELLGKDAMLLQALDATSAAHALGDPGRLRAWATLIRLESDALRLAGDSSAADRLAERASGLEKAAES